MWRKKKLLSKSIWWSLIKNQLRFHGTCDKNIFFRKKPTLAELTLKALYGRIHFFIFWHNKSFKMPFYICFSKKKISFPYRVRIRTLKIELSSAISPFLTIRGHRNKGKSSWTFRKFKFWLAGTRDAPAGGNFFLMELKIWQFLPYLKFISNYWLWWIICSLRWITTT